MDIFLRHNIFSFHDCHWKQEIGAAMGSETKLNYANTFLEPIDETIRNLAEKYNYDMKKALILFKRF